MRLVKALLLTALALPAFVTSPARAETTVERWSAGDRGTHPRAVVIKDDEQLIVNLSALPERGKVHWARLHVLRRTETPPKDPIEIVPTGTAIGEQATPLKLADDLRSFDCTELVRKRASSPDRELSLALRKFPDGLPQATYLEVAFSGRSSKAVPPAVKGLTIHHHAGQTFITWKEIETLVAKEEILYSKLKPVLRKMDQGREVRYCIYRAQRPITSENLHQAELVGKVKPLSGFNINARCVEPGIEDVLKNQFAYSPRPYAEFRPISTEAGIGAQCPIRTFVIKEGASALTPGTGLFVYSASSPQTAYYAVITSVDGTQNTTDLSAENSLRKPVLETVAQPAPVKQAVIPPAPYFDYPGKQYHYVQWTDLSGANQQGACYNWSVVLPKTPANGDAAKHPLPLEVCFPVEGRSYYRITSRIYPNSLVLVPYDFPFDTRWHGYADARGTLRPAEKATFRPYTQTRINQFIDWANKRFNIDANRLVASGRSSSGATGALRTVLFAPKLFSCIYAEGPTPDDGLVTALKSMPPSEGVPYMMLTRPKSRGAWSAFCKTMEAQRRGMVLMRDWASRMLPQPKTHRQPQQDLRKDGLVLALLDPKMTDESKKALRSYSLPVQWDPKTVVDKQARLEVTFWAKHSGDLLVRQFQKLSVKKGGAFNWQVERDGQEKIVQKGVITADQDNVLVVPGVTLWGKRRLAIWPAR